MTYKQASDGDAGPLADGTDAAARVTSVPLHGGTKKVPYDLQLERQLAVARRVLIEQADVLRGLAEYDRA